MSVKKNRCRKMKTHVAYPYKLEAFVLDPNSKVKKEREKY